MTRFTARLLHKQTVLLNQLDIYLLRADTEPDITLSKFLAVLRTWYGDYRWWMDGFTRMQLLWFRKELGKADGGKVISFAHFYEKLSFEIFSTIRPPKKKYEVGALYTIFVRAVPAREE